MSAHHADDGLPAPVSTLAEDPPADGRQAPPSGVVVGEDGRARPPWAARDPLLREYYDTEWGLPVTDERGLFERLVLEDLGDGRTRLTSTSLVDSFEGRDGFVASGMEVGVNEGYEKLDELLARS